MYAVFDETGKAISYGTVLANPLPEGYTYIELEPQEEAVLEGGGLWDEELHTIVETPYSK